MRKPRHVRALEAAKREVPRGASNYALRVLCSWFNLLGAAVVLTEDTSPCPDCREHSRLFYTRTYGGLCPPCTLARMDNGGHNVRLDRLAERRLMEGSA